MDINEQFSVYDQITIADKAFEYYFGRGTRSHGGGQAEGILACSHGGRVGAPCCKPCAVKFIRQTIARLNMTYAIFKEKSKED